ncbi:MAG: hypothetical protein H0U67_09825, partial [Gemmatimonadetes bacterium]|nr:hypothetical protein [Gemmatimonadota bacterium]
MRPHRTAAFLARYRVALFLGALALLGAGMAFTQLPRFTGSLRGFDLRENHFYATKLYTDSLFGGGTTVYVTITPTSPDIREVIAGVRALEERIATAYPDASLVSLSRYYQFVYAPANPSPSLEQFLA